MWQAWPCARVHSRHHFHLNRPKTFKSLPPPFCLDVRRRPRCYDLQHTANPHHKLPHTGIMASPAGYDEAPKEDNSKKILFRFCPSWCGCPSTYLPSPPGLTPTDTAQ